jgi:cysteate synthase
MPDGDGSVLVIASAGNTAAAFARVCSLFEVACLIIVPEAALAALRLVEPIADHVKIVSLGGLADYYDAIQLAARVSQFDGFVAEGGVWNVARRDGLGTVVLDAVEKIGRLPDYYFQAVGSGAGGIAAYEAANKLLGDGRFGSTPPRLMLAQNAPFAPIYHSWRTGERKLVEFSDDAAKLQVQELCAHVLSNRRPPFATTGGIYDALSDTGGDALIADNDEVARAGRLFEEAEGIDVDPAASVAFAALLQAVGDGRVERDAVTLLNVTGGGRRRLMHTLPLVQARPMLELMPEDLGRDGTAARVAELFDG